MEKGYKMCHLIIAEKFAVPKLVDPRRDREIKEKKKEMEIKTTIKATTNSIIMYCNNFYWFESETAAYQMCPVHKTTISMYCRFTENLLL